MGGPLTLVRQHDCTFSIATWKAAMLTIPYQLHLHLQVSKVMAVEDPQVEAARRLSNSVAKISAYVRQHTSKHGENFLRCRFDVRLQLE